MKYYGSMSDPKDLVNKGYVDGAVQGVVNGTRGQIGLLPNVNIDDFATDKIYGTYYLNNSDNDITGTKPDTSGQGLLFCKQQSSAIYRQIYIGVSSSSAMKVRYYYNNAWTQWNDLPIRREVDALKNTTTGSFILDSAQSGATSSLVIKQCGKVVSVNGYITGLTLTSITYIGKISGVSNPASYLRLYANVGTNAWSPGTVSYLAVDTDGSINITTSETGSNKAVYFSLTYIAA